MRKLSFILLLFLSRQAAAQHCPWDCSGLLMLKTTLTVAEFNQLSPMLVDGDKNPVIDTVYGTGVDSYDTCRFLYYDDFVDYRTKRIKLHYWYNYDTLYRFAKDHYVVRYNYCKYKKAGNSDLFLRYKDTVTKEYHYIEIPLSRRIHLHDLNREIRDKLTLAEIPSLKGLIMETGRKEWNLPEQ